MPQIDIPYDLLQQIQQSLPAAGTVDGFVRAAIEDKLAWQGRRNEFYRLSDNVRQAMSDRGISEAEVLAEFDAVLDGASVQAYGARLTRDQLHDRG